MKLTDPHKQFITIGISAMFGPDDSLSDLYPRVIEEYYKQPDRCTDGGNDKEFFSFKFNGVKIFVAANEANGLTVMLPDEY